MGTSSALKNSLKYFCFVPIFIFDKILPDCKNAKKVIVYWEKDLILFVILSTSVSDVGSQYNKIEGITFKATPIDRSAKMAWVAIFTTSATLILVRVHFTINSSYFHVSCIIGVKTKMRLTLSSYFSPNNIGFEQLEFKTILQVLFSNIFPMKRFQHYKIYTKLA